MRLTRLLRYAAILIGLALALPAQATLAERLPRSPAIVVRDGVPFIQSPGGITFTVLRVEEDDDIVVSWGQTSLSIHPDIFSEGCTDSLDQIPLLVEQAGTSGLPVSTFRLRDVHLIGPHLSTEDTWVLPEGVARRVSLPDGSKQDAIDQASAGIRGFVAQELPRLGLGPLAQDALRHTLERALVHRDASGEVTDPEFVRHLLRHQWLRAVAPRATALDGLDLALQPALTLRAVSRLEGVGIKITRWESAFDHGGWSLETPKRSGFVRELPDPPYLSLDAVLVVSAMFAPGTDPLNPTAQISAASVHLGRGAVASWSESTGFSCDASHWAGLVERHPNLCTDAFPPHVPVIDLEGNLRAIFTAHGRVDAPVGSEPSTHDRFLDQAARALPDAAHLDLIGEWMLAYVNDSPDPERPTLLGSSEVLGEIHQTVTETLTTTVGGRCRGDCDDLAELYRAIAVRQKRLAHIMSLPAHNALCWVEERDPTFHTFVLQTGPPLEFLADSAPNSLRSAYKSFEAGQGFDPNQIGIAVRFSGDNIRSNWVLGWRIFVDRTYAETMIDVQRDWHFGTYQQGVRKMLALVDSGDRDPANLHELAGLAGATGQWELATQYQRRALELTGDPIFTLRTALLSNEYELEHWEQARSLARQLAETDLLAAKEALGEDWFPVALGVGTLVLLKDRESGLAEPLLREVSDHAQSLCMGLLRYRQSRQFRKELWEQDETIRHHRLFLQQYVAITVGCLLELRDSEAFWTSDLCTTLTFPIDLWWQTIALHDLDEPADVLARYGALGAYHHAILGWPALRALIESAPWPEEVPVAASSAMPRSHLRRELPYVRSSVNFYTAVIAYLLRDDAESLDRELFRWLDDQQQQALEASRRLGLDSRQFEDTRLGMAVARALVDGDQEALRSILQRIARQNDKAQRDLARQWYASLARFVPADTFEASVQTWGEVINHKPSWFTLAWACWLHDAPQQAITVAKHGVALHPDDESFAVELEHMLKRAQEAR